MLMESPKLYRFAQMIQTSQRRHWNIAFITLPNDFPKQYLNFNKIAL